MAFPFEKTEQEFEHEKNRGRLKAAAIVLIFVCAISGIGVYFAFFKNGTDGVDGNSGGGDGGGSSYNITFSQSYSEGNLFRFDSDGSSWTFIDPRGELVVEYSGQFENNLSGWKTLYDWAYSNFSYQSRGDYYPPIHPENMLLDFQQTSKLRGMCGDVAVLVVSMYLAVGVPPEDVRIVIGDFEGVSGRHGWVELRVDNHWLPLEFTTPGQYFEKYASVKHVDTRSQGYNNWVCWDFEVVRGG